MDLEGCSEQFGFDPEWPWKRWALRGLNEIVNEYGESGDGGGGDDE